MSASSPSPNPSVENLVMLPCYQWNRGVITPPGHPLLAEKQLTLEAIARHPIVTYDFAFNAGFADRQGVRDAQGIKTNVALTAVDADVIKGYVELGVGVGILAKMAFDPARDTGLRLIDASHLFEPSTTRIAVRRNAYLQALRLRLHRAFRAAPLARRSSRRRCAAPAPTTSCK